MRGILISLALMLSACSPLIEARTQTDTALAGEEPIMAAPAALEAVPCPLEATTSDDGIGGTGCK